MYDKKVVENARSAETLPKPSGYQLLIYMPKVKEKTEGGVFLPGQALEREEIAAIVGYVVDIGPDAYKDTAQKSFPSGPWCKIGDWVMFRSYTGTRFSIKGERFLFINDDSVQGVVQDPREIIRT